MPKLRLLTVALSAALLTTPVFAGNGNNSNGRIDRGTPPPTANEMLETLPIAAPLDTTESETLLFMREEERLARDVYLQLETLWQSPPFAGIAQSEQRHMDTIKLLMDRYSLTEPSDPTANGIFADTELQTLYTSLVAKGELSLLDALMVGALIEETDIADLTDAIANTDNVDLQTVYDHLQRGSRNHLRAYITEIERQGGDAYIAQHLTQDEVDAIMAERMERGGHGGTPSAGTGDGTGQRGAGGGRH